MKTWRHRFESYLVDDPVAIRMVKKLLEKGFHERQVLSALEHYTDPALARRLRKVFKDFAPLRERTKRMAQRCAKLNQELRASYGSPFGVSLSEASGMLHLADILERASVQLNRIDHTNALSDFTERKLWNGLPLAILYEELNIPKSLSWDDWHPLYRIARQAHGLPDDLVGPKSLATNHRRLLKRSPLARCLARTFANLHARMVATTLKAS